MSGFDIYQIYESECSTGMCYFFSCLPSLTRTLSPVEVEAKWGVAAGVRQTVEQAVTAAIVGPHLANKAGTYSLFIYQDEDENENQSFRSFMYVLKQTCDE